MPRLTALAAGFLAAALAASAAAQQQPDFSGTWVATRETPASVAAAPSAVFGERFGFRASDGRLALARGLRGASFVMDFPLDGTEVRAVVPGRPCMGDASTVASLSRDAAGLTYTLISNTAAGAQPARGAFKYFFRLESAETLVVESTIRDSAQAAPRQVGTVYRRSADAMPAPPAARAVAGAPATIAGLDWLAGDWEAQLGSSSVEERWTPAAGGAMLAISRTTRGGTMSEFEFLCIAERAGSLVYTAMPNAGPSTDFVLTALDASGATFENPAHDFPKKIRYAKRDDGGVDAIVSGAEGRKPLTFAFKRR